MNELDEIMSGDSNAAPEIQQEQPVTQPRDDSGRFATKQEAPAVVEQPVAEVQPVSQELTEEHPANGGIPQARLKAEAEKRREAEADAAALRREIAELRGMVQARQQPAQPQQEKPAPNLFEAPEEYITSQLSPVQQQLQEMREELWESRASALHTPEALQAAKEAAGALAGTPQGRALHEHIMAGGNPFDNLVKWHKQQQVYSRIGDNPDAWLDAEIEKRMQDPQFLAQAVERARAGASATVNRSQPNTNLPRSISRLPAGGNMPADNDMSDGALFSNAMR